MKQQMDNQEVGRNVEFSSAQKKYIHGLLSKHETEITTKFHDQM